MIDRNLFGRIGKVLFVALAGMPGVSQAGTCDLNGQTDQQWNINSNGTITGIQSGLCLDANGAGTANGTKLILWGCHDGTNQQWSLRN